MVEINSKAAFEAEVSNASPVVYASFYTDGHYKICDGSFIIYDGGYRHHAEHLWNTLVEMNGSEENILIRAWIITHAQGRPIPVRIKTV